MTERDRWEAAWAHIMRALGALPCSPSAAPARIQLREVASMCEREAGRGEIEEGENEPEETDLDFERKERLEASR